MNLDLTGKTALVGGSTQGIGRAAAFALAQLGATVTLIARNKEELVKTAAALPKDKGQQHGYLIADYGDLHGLQKAVESLIAGGGVFHILVNNTGGPAGGPAEKAKLEEFSDTFQKHLLVNHVLMQAVVPGMKDANYGRIINVISTSVKQSIKGLGVSNTIRAAVGNWSKTLSVELAPFGITVNNVLPGATLTQRLVTLLEARSVKAGIAYEELEKEMLQEIPAGRFAQPEEIANAIAFLATPAASYINGINVPVDGGRTGNL